MSPADQHVYVDANIFIFALESEARFGPQSAAVLRAVDEGRYAAVTSELTLAEVLVKPIEFGRSDLAEQFLTVVSRSKLRLHPVSRSVLLLSAEIRAKHGRRLADAIHVATAVEAGCQAIISEDLRMRTPPTLTRVSAAEFLSAQGLLP